MHCGFTYFHMWHRTKTRLLDKTIDSRVRVKLMMQFIAIMRVSGVIQIILDDLVK